MKILFITRKYPPTKGGMEKVAYDLYNHLSEIEDVILVKWGGSNKWLPLVLPSILIRSFLILLTNKVDVIYLQDGLLSPLGVILKLFRVPIVITIHGLDITYRNKVYQFVVPRCVAQLDNVICISQATKEECMHRGIPRDKMSIVPNGISDDFFIENKNRDQLKETLSNELNINLTDKKIILSVGRLVERKGLHWFIENVIPKIKEQRQDFVYLIVGDGIFKDTIREIIDRNNLEDDVVMLGKVDDKILKILYNSSDVFAMPNIPVEGDMEGFGVVILEAASCGVPVVASELEGIKAAVKNGKNGFLVEFHDVNMFAEVIIELLKKDYEIKDVGKRAREFTLENYEWGKIAEQYYNVFEEVTKSKTMSLREY
jgi:phosphatidyl-myo-inositol dimannoside synthase